MIGAVDLGKLPEGERRMAFERMIQNMRKNPKISDHFVKRIEGQMRAGLLDPVSGLFAPDERLRAFLSGGTGAEDVLKQKTESRMRADLVRKTKSDQFRQLQAIVDDVSGRFSDAAKQEAATKMRQMLGIKSNRALPENDPLNAGSPAAILRQAKGAGSRPAGPPPVPQPAPVQQPAQRPAPAPGGGSVARQYRGAAVSGGGAPADTSPGRCDANPDGSLVSGAPR